MPATASHRFEDHTGEVRMRLHAQSLQGLFHQAALALAELMAARSPLGPLAEEERIELEARDPEALLVDWLDELIYRADVEGRVYRSLEIDALTETRLEARIRGGAPAEWKTSVKAATFHGLHIERGEGGWQAAVVLDV